MIERGLLIAVLLCAFASAASASSGAGSTAGTTDPGSDQEMVPNRESPAGVKKAAQQAEEDQTPGALRWMLKPLKRGMFVRLPIIDTDPNRGITYGVMPILVLQGENDDRIKQIHAPSLTYNKDFKLSPTYRYYYYPEDDAAFVGRLSRAKYENEVMAEYTDHSLFGTNYD